MKSYRSNKKPCTAASKSKSASVTYHASPRHWIGAYLNAMLVVALGCGSSNRIVEGRVETIATTGTVMIDGTPAENVIVVFHATTHNLSASGRTDATGRFSLTTYDQGDGAVSGTHLVSLRKTSVTTTPDPRGEPFPPTTKELSLIATEYANPRTSGLTANVSPGRENDFLFEVESSR